MSDLLHFDEVSGIATPLDDHGETLLEIDIAPGNLPSVNDTDGGGESEAIAALQNLELDPLDNTPIPDDTESESWWDIMERDSTISLNESAPNLVHDPNTNTKTDAPLLPTLEIKKDTGAKPKTPSITAPIGKGPSTPAPKLVTGEQVGPWEDLPQLRSQDPTGSVAQSLMTIRPYLLPSPPKVGYLLSYYRKEDRLGPVYPKHKQLPGVLAPNTKLIQYSTYLAQGIIKLHEVEQDEVITLDDDDEDMGGAQFRSTDIRVRTPGTKEHQKHQESLQQRSLGSSKRPREEAEPRPPEAAPNQPPPHKPCPECHGTGNLNWSLYLDYLLAERLAQQKAPPAPPK